MADTFEPVKRGIKEFQEYLRRLGRMGVSLVTPPIYVRDTIEQLDAIGVGSLMVTLLTGLFTGMVLALQSGLTLDRYGVRQQVGSLVAASMVKELGPVLTALIVAGRVGSGIAAELGSMVVTDQIAALRALGADPVRKLVIPRVLAGTVMLPVLTTLAVAVGILGGAIISGLQLGVASSVYWNSVVSGLYMNDIWMGLIKPVVLGFVVTTVGCYVGLRTTGGTQGVGRATTTSVVVGSIAVLGMDFLLTKFLITVMY
jgi:phospholipid/cholesterol/gamma-HCH transport system permease protein